MLETFWGGEATSYSGLHNTIMVATSVPDTVSVNRFVPHIFENFGGGDFPPGKIWFEGEGEGGRFTLPGRRGGG